jgi:hypothetical protein
MKMPEVSNHHKKEIYEFTLTTTKFGFGLNGIYELDGKLDDVNFPRRSIIRVYPSIISSNFTPSLFISGCGKSGALVQGITNFDPSRLLCISCPNHTNNISFLAYYKGDFA